MFRPGFLSDIGDLGNQDPYDLSVCWPQYREEAERLVREMRDNITNAGRALPGEAAALDERLKALIQKHRDANACPNLSEFGRHKFQDEVKQLREDAIELAKRAAAPPPAAPAPVSIPGPGPASIAAPAPADILAPPLDLPQTDTSGDSTILLAGGGLMFMAMLGIGAWLLLRNPAPAPAARRKRRR